MEWRLRARAPEPNGVGGYMKWETICSDLVKIKLFSISPANLAVIQRVSSALLLPYRQVGYAVTSSIAHLLSGLACRRRRSSVFWGSGAPLLRYNPMVVQGLSLFSHVFYDIVI